MSDVMRSLTNLLYLVPWRVRRHRHRHPGVEVLAAGATKARRSRRPAELRRGLGWVLAKRSTLILDRRALTCGSWSIDLNEVRQASMLLVGRSGAVLAIETVGGMHYQFGLTRDDRWSRQDALDMTVTSAPVRWSVFSVALRLVILAMILYLVLAQMR